MNDQADQPPVAPEFRQACRFCAKPIVPKARLCTECKQFQHLGDRILSGGVSLGALIAVIPTLTLAFTFLSQNIERPRSRLTAVISRCSLGELTVALSNTGNRSAIVDGGKAVREVSGAPPYARALRTPGPDFAPVVVEGGKTAIVRFTLVDLEDQSYAMPMPLNLPPAKCSYEVELGVLEFGGDRKNSELGTCSC